MNRKPFLKWTLEDYQKANEEPPECVKAGTTEGEAMEKEDIEEWAREEIQILSVLKEEFPNRFKDQYECFVCDLEYLYELGKITQEEKEILISKDNFKFGQDK